MAIQTLFKTLAIAFSTMTLFTGIIPLYGTSLTYAGPTGVVWGWVIVSFFTWFVGTAMAEICSSFPVISDCVVTGAFCLNIADVTDSELVVCL